ncbi:MAG: tetratricopeptide repeat protein, partial [Roseiflexaceae bacterium]|nr:tetratricopeptide repeat protein [Roseiflexaceae bacterium]
MAGSRVLHEESLSHFRKLGDAHGTALALTNLGLVLVDSGNTDLAAARLEESLVLWHQLGEQVDIAECLEGIAAIAVADGDDMRAAQLW